MALLIYSDKGAMEIHIPAGASIDPHKKIPKKTASSFGFLFRTNRASKT